MEQYRGIRLLPYKSLTSTPDLQVSIIDCNHLLGKVASDKWLLQEDKILFALIVELERSNANFYAPFDGAKWNFLKATSKLLESSGPLQRLVFKSESYKLFRFLVITQQRRSHWINIALH